MYVFSFILESFNCTAGKFGAIAIFFSIFFHNMFNLNNDFCFLVIIYTKNETFYFNYSYISKLDNFLVFKNISNNYFMFLQMRSIHAFIHLYYILLLICSYSMSLLNLSYYYYFLFLSLKILYKITRSLIS